MGNGLILAYGGQWGVGAWIWLFVPLVVYAFVVLGLYLATPAEECPGNYFFGQISLSLERATGFPGWAMAGILSALWSLLVVVIGYYWDVAWHADNGRDTQLFTVPHLMILLGLGGLIYAAGLTVFFASIEKVEVGVRFGPLRIPWSSILLFGLGVGAVAAFPLDNLWHHAYGIDVTLWSPTHLQLVIGGSLGTLGVMMLCLEAMPKGKPNMLGRGIYALCVGTVLIGLSTVQGEFDYGIPQFQLLYLPLLIALAAGFALVLARLVLGRGGALKAVLVFLIIRLFLVWAVAGVFHDSVPHFPLYLPSALAVEAAALLVGEANRLRFAVVAGALVGTVGLAGELAWVRVIEGAAVSSSSLLVKTIILGPIVAIAAAILGAGVSRAASASSLASHEQQPIPAGAFGIAGVVLLLALAYPLPRRVGQVTATIRLQPNGTSAVVDVTLDPPDAAKNADAFNVLSWQGGGLIDAPLKQVGPGEFRTSRAMPIYGHWKTAVNLIRGDQLMIAPVSFPADPAIGAAAIPPVATRTTPFVRNTKLLLREKHPGPAWVAWAAYAGVAVSGTVWVLLIVLNVAHVGSSLQSAPATGTPSWRLPPGPPAASNGAQSPAGSNGAQSPPASTPSFGGGYVPSFGPWAGSRGAPPPR